MPNANMCSRRPLVLSEKFLLIRFDSVTLTRHLRTRSHEPTLISTELTAKNLILKLS